MNGMLGQFLHGLSVWALPIVFAVTLHEAAHGFAALALGDDTARRAGRLSLNPIRHVDPFGTLVLPAILLMVGGFLFGWAKPVPVDFSRLRNPRWGMVLVALAGPATNVLLALASVLLVYVVHYLPEAGQRWAVENLRNAMLINLVLAVFNMLPLPPLDGGRVAVGILPAPLGLRLARLESKGMLILIGLLFILPLVGHQLGVDLDLLPRLIFAVVGHLSEFLVTVAGIV